MTAQTLLGKKRGQDRIARHSGMVQWKKDGPYLELDGKPIGSSELPVDVPASKTITDDDGYITRLGPAIVVPSPWVDAARNKAAARFWRSKGFVMRDATNHDGLICTDLREWVRMIDTPLGGKVFSASAWLESVRKKYQEFYL